MPQLARLLPHVMFALLLVGVGAISWSVTGSVAPPSGASTTWLYSGLVMLLFSMFYVEPHYGAPKNVMAHSVAVLLVLLSVRGELAASGKSLFAYHVLLVYSAGTLMVSWLAGNIGDPEKPDGHWNNRAAEVLKNVSVLFGEARILYSCVFLLFLPLFYVMNQPPVLAAIVFWWFLVITNPQRRLSKALAGMRLRRAEIAEITGVQSGKVFLARAYPSATIKPLDTVEFSYAVDEDTSTVKRGIVVSSHFLENEKWIRVLELESLPSERKSRPNAIHRIAAPTHGPTKDAVSRFVGVVVERSEIGTIRFEVIPEATSIEEGDLVEVRVGEQKVIYQVVNAETGKEQLQAKNESGYICADAVQLGCWDSEKGAFKRFGWLPDMTAPVLKAEPSGQVPPHTPPEQVLGVLPGTSIPLMIDLNTARTHHMALLGITGSGKSFIALELIREMLADTRVICIDFTEEYMEKLATLNPTQLIKVEGLRDVETTLAQRTDAMQRRDGKAEALEYKRQIEGKLEGYVKDFLEGENHLAVFELPDLSNTTFVLEFTQMFLEAVFFYAKANRGQRICIVIEEAHTVVPETSSLGDFGDYSSNKALVNKIGQIALQGRKYGVGFFIIAQRTANVSKTVLTQCNTIICFQAFDETSYKFLENHLGSHMTKALPRLKPYHAIAVGKAFRGNMPMIVDLKRPLPALAISDPTGGCEPQAEPQPVQVLAAASVAP